MVKYYKQWVYKGLRGEALLAMLPTGSKYGYKRKVLGTYIQWDHWVSRVKDLHPMGINPMGING